jgi:hypothetical protein
MDDGLHLWSVTVTLPNRVRDVEVELLGKVRSGWEITSNEEEVVGTVCRAKTRSWPVTW